MIVMALMMKAVADLIVDYAGRAGEIGSITARSRP
jgi:hypothetical protein